MRLPEPRPARRGQPLMALAVLMLAWVGARTALWAGSLPVEEDTAQAASAPAVMPTPRPPRNSELPTRAKAGETARPSGPAAPMLRPEQPLAAPNLIAPEPTAAEPAIEPAAAAPASEPPTAVPPRIAAGHAMLYLAGVAALPLPQEALAATTPPGASAPPVPYLPGSGTQALRWSADGWLLWREGGNGFNLPGAGLPGASLPSGAYGSSQAGLVIRYRLAPQSTLRPTLYLRGSTGLYHPRGEELAAGIALRPLRGIPVSAMAEARVTRTTTGTAIRPAVALVTELPPARLPLGLRGEAYAQAGWVGGKDHTPFIDGQARIDAPVARAGKLELRLGAGAWGGAQRGAARLDMGPSATLDLPLGPARTRLSADYRFRVAGDAAPDSGAAITFSAGF